MGMPTLLTVNGTGTSAIWQPDWMQNPFSIGIGAISAQGAGYKIEACMDDLNVSISTSLATNAYTAGNATWYPISPGIVAVSTTMTVTFPVTGLRINIVTAGSIASSVSVNFIQATYGR